MVNKHKKKYIRPVVEVIEMENILFSDRSVHNPGAKSNTSTDDSWDWEGNSSSTTDKSTPQSVGDFGYYKSPVWDE